MNVPPVTRHRESEAGQPNTYSLKPSEWDYAKFGPDLTNYEAVHSALQSLMGMLSDRNLMGDYPTPIFDRYGAARVDTTMSCAAAAFWQTVSGYGAAKEYGNAQLPVRRVVIEHCKAYPSDIGCRRILLRFEVYGLFARFLLAAKSTRYTADIQWNARLPAETFCPKWSLESRDESLTLHVWPLTSDASLRRWLERWGSRKLELLPA